MTRKRPRGWLVSPKQVHAWLDKAEGQVVEGDLEGAIRTAQRVTRVVPSTSKPYGEAQYQIGLAHAMLRHPRVAYAAFVRAAEVLPEDPYVLYNLGLAARMTMRSAQSLRVLERALPVAAHPELRARCEEELAVARQLVESNLALRGPGFTLEDLLEQEELFQEGVDHMQARRWTAAEATFHRIIAMADCLPQTHGNLAGIMTMQARYDEAEAELRRALDIDPDYDLARANLALLPRLRRGEVPEFEVRDPLAGAHQTVTFLPAVQRE
jgi:tetratricopeptide (TPR) repeat protein